MPVSSQGGLPLLPCRLVPIACPAAPPSAVLSSRLYFDIQSTVSESSPRGQGTVCFHVFEGLQHPAKCLSYTRCPVDTMEALMARRWVSGNFLPLRPTIEALTDIHCTSFLSRGAPLHPRPHFFNGSQAMDSSSSDQPYW